MGPVTTDGRRTPRELGRVRRDEASTSRPSVDDCKEPVDPERFIGGSSATAIAMVCRPPAAMDVTHQRPPPGMGGNTTWPGTPVKLPSHTRPSRPSELRPKESTRPSSVSSAVCVPPSAASTTLSLMSSSTGRLLSVQCTACGKCVDQTYGVDGRT